MRAHAFAAALLAEIPNSPVGAFSEHGRGACTALQASEQMTTDRGEGSWRVSDSRREAKVILFRSIDGKDAERPPEKGKCYRARAGWHV